jgi:hypothetical protein
MGNTPFRVKVTQAAAWKNEAKKRTQVNEKL